MDTIKWKWQEDMNEFNEFSWCFELSLQNNTVCSLFSSRQERVYLSLQSHLVTLQVLSASPLLQEFIPHLLHLSSRAQTLSLLRSHTLWWQLLSGTVWDSLSTGATVALRELKCWGTRVNSQRALVNWWAGLSCLAAFHLLLKSPFRRSVTGVYKKKKKKDMSHVRKVAVGFHFRVS